MEERIVNIIRLNPKGIRKREIAAIMRIWTPHLAKPMAELEKKGLIKSVLYSDPANAEYYDLWFLA